MPSRSEIAEQTAKKLRIIPPTKQNRPCDTEVIVWDAFTQTWDALIDAKVELAELNLELQKRDKCAYIGPMRDCPTHGESERVKELRYALRRIIQDLPTRRDWLDPALERRARAVLSEEGKV